MRGGHTPRRPRRAGAAIAYRNRELAQIHQAKKQLALDDETYRALLHRVTGKLSSADMTASERQAVLAEFVRLGFEAPAPQRGFAGRPKDTDQVPLLGKVEALLTTARRPWSYAHGMARQMFGRDRLEFLHASELHKLVQALEVDARRRARRMASSEAQE